MNLIHLVIANTGEFGDLCRRTLAAFDSEAAATAYRAELMALAIAEGVSRTQLNEGEDDFHCSFWVDSFANRQQFCDRYPDLTPGRIDDNGIWWDIKTVPHNPALPTT